MYATTHTGTVTNHPRATAVDPRDPSMGEPMPRLSIEDNVRLTHDLLRELNCRMTCLLELLIGPMPTEANGDTCKPPEHVAYVANEGRVQASRALDLIGRIRTELLCGNPDMAEKIRRAQIP